MMIFSFSFHDIDYNFKRMQANEIMLATAAVADDDSVVVVALKAITNVGDPNFKSYFPVQVIAFIHSHVHTVGIPIPSHTCTHIIYVLKFFEGVICHMRHRTHSRTKQFLVNELFASEYDRKLTALK